MNRVERLKQAATDRQAVDIEREAAMELLQELAKTSISETERDDAAMVLATLDKPVTGPRDTTNIMLERFLLEHPPLDALSVRFLRDSKRSTFLNISHADVAQFLQREWAVEPDAKAHEQKDRRLQMVWDAVTEVRSRFDLLYKDISPTIAELLGVDVSGDPEEALATAKRDYIAVATATVDVR